MNTIQLALGNPLKASRVALALAKGRWVRFRCMLTGRRLVGGKGLRVFGRLTIRGPGTLELDDGVVVEMHVTAFTYSREARIKVGARTVLNGTRFGCVESITIGDRCLLGESHIFDTNFHSTAANRWEPDAVVVKRPVTLADNVWLSFNACILPGTTVGENSVIGFGAVCNGSYPANMIIAGSSARAVKAIPGAPNTE